MIGNAEWAARCKRELTANILPFWMRHTVDQENGGFYGAVDCDGRVNQQAPRAAVINERILWTFSAAARRLGDPAYRETADWAYAYLDARFRDRECGGVYWMLDFMGNPISDRKQIYAQAFAIYGLTEYFRATGCTQALEWAQQIYGLIESKSRDPEHGGYLEACGRDWGTLEDMRLSEKDLNCPKSMNTHLHVLEAYTNLLRVWPDDCGSTAQLLEMTMDRIVDCAAGHFKLFFDRRWNSLSDHVSFGHDIEGSWLMVEAAEVLGDAALLERARTLAVRMATAVYEEGLDRDGSLFYEASRGRMADPNKHWWAQAEAVVGFYNAYQISSDDRFRTAACRAWQYIEEHVVDKVHGEWHAKLKPDGTPWKAEEDPDACLVGAWKCPYHNVRVCLEMMERLR
ncbi:MAG TPA: AGE family epimerase/isomerase [Bryobacteraceae bacterium]|nr:AGE family epimerase/isomerase [Bryobacteraceae bacterium]